MVFVLGLPLNISVIHNQVSRTSCLAHASSLPQTRGLGEGGAHQVHPPERRLKQSHSKNVPLFGPCAHRAPSVLGGGSQVLRLPWALTDPQSPSLWRGGLGARRDPYPNEHPPICSSTQQEPYCFLHFTSEDTELETLGLSHPASKCKGEI